MVKRGGRIELHRTHLILWIKTIETKQNKTKQFHSDPIQSNPIQSNRLAHTNTILRLYQCVSDVIAGCVTTQLKEANCCLLRRTLVQLLVLFDYWIRPTISIVQLLVLHDDQYYPTIIIIQLLVLSSNYQCSSHQTLVTKDTSGRPLLVGTGSID